MINFVVMVLVGVVCGTATACAFWWWRFRSTEHEESTYTSPLPVKQPDSSRQLDQLIDDTYREFTENKVRLGKLAPYIEFESNMHTEFQSLTMFDSTDIIRVVGALDGHSGEQDVFCTKRYVRYLLSHSGRVKVMVYKMQKPELRLAVKN